MLVSKVCLALETTPICNLGSERLYENFINECVSIGVNKNEFSANFNVVSFINYI